MGINMRTSISGTFVALVALLPAAAAAQSDTEFVPPTAVAYHSDFDTPVAVPERWQIDAGVWSVSGGSYNSTSTAPATSIITDYKFESASPPIETIGDDYTFRARVRIQGTSAAGLAGVVFDHVDAANYNEAVFSTNGRYVVRQVRNGVSTDLLNATYRGGGLSVWFDVEVIRRPGTVLVRASGIGGVWRAIGPNPSQGRLGLTSRNTTARFDKVSIAFRFGEQPFKENFSQDGLSEWFTSGTWTTADGTATNTSLQRTSIAMHGDIRIDLFPHSTFGYSLRARMLNPHGTAGNLVGLIFNQTSSGNRGEALFSPLGVARIDLVHDGITETIATAPYPGRRNEWFDVTADVSAGFISIRVNGTMIFKNVNTDPIFFGGGGLITHWARGKFDDVWFDNRSSFVPLSVGFDSAPPADWIVSGTWDTNGGTLNDVSAGGASDIVTTNCACWETDFSYRARLLNQSGGTGNRVGLVYNYQRRPFRESDSRPYVGVYNGDYYEVVFAPTGQAFINKVLNGERYRVAMGSHSVPSNVWFNVEVLRQGLNTTVKVNGKTVFDRVRQGELPFGDVGVVSHWSKARFDNLTVGDAAMR